MVFASICEHASSMLIFASTSSCQIFLASSEHFRKIQMASSENFEYFVNFPLAGISLLLIGYVALRQVIANNLAHTSKQNSQNSRCKTGAVQPVAAFCSQLCPRLVWLRSYMVNSRCCGRCYVKKTYTTVYFPYISHSSRGKLAR